MRVAPDRLARAGRVAVALGLAMAWLSFGRVLDVDGVPFAPGPLAALPMNPLVASVASFVFASTLSAWASQRREDLTAALLVVLLAAGTQVQAWQWPGDEGANGATMLPGAALTAWWVARRFGGPAAVRDRRAVDAACGMVAGGYFVAAASKVAGSGLAWASAGNIGLQIAAQAAIVGGPLHTLRAAAAESPVFCGLLGVATLVIEGGAVAYVWPPARPWLTVAIVGMHLGIGLLMGLHHYDWMFTTLGLGLASAAEDRR